MPASWILTIVVLFLGVSYGLIYWQRARIAELHEFLGDVKNELKKVNWPVRKEVVATTSVVIVAIFFFGVYLSVIDFVVDLARTMLYSAVGAGKIS